MTVTRLEAAQRIADPIERLRMLRGAQEAFQEELRNVRADAVIEARQQGLTQAEIARRVGLGEARVSQLSTRWNRCKTTE